jgi:hypothetical protein
MQGAILKSDNRRYSVCAPADSAPAKARRRSRSLLLLSRGLAEIPIIFKAISAVKYQYLMRKATGVKEF